MHGGSNCGKCGAAAEVLIPVRIWKKGEEVTIDDLCSDCVDAAKTEKFVVPKSVTSEEGGRVARGAK